MKISEISDSKNTSFITICLIILRTIRTERNYTQAQVADWLNKNPSAWTKIENGKTSLTIDILLKWCENMRVRTSDLISAAERHSLLLTSSADRWSVTNMYLPEDEDDLLKYTHQYWSSPGFRLKPRRPVFSTILNDPETDNYGRPLIDPVFQFALDPYFRSSQMEEIRTPRHQLGASIF